MVKLAYLENEITLEAFDTEGRKFEKKLNGFAIKAQEDKIKQLTNQIKNLIIIKELNDCKSFDPSIIKGR